MGVFSLKRLCGFAILIFVLYIIYYDTNIGTLPTAGSGKESTEITEVDSTVKDVNYEEAATNKGTPFQELEVNAGDTVLSMVEQIGSNTSTLSISDIILDFENLNPGEKANSLQIGKKYKFPVYE